MSRFMTNLGRVTKVEIKITRDKQPQPMYIPKSFNQDDPELHREVIEKYPLATLITAVSTATLFNTSAAPKVTINHIPFHINKDGTKLIAHLSKRNSQLEDLEQLQRLGHECTLVFQTENAYISPSWYTNKPKTHKYVPTWNFGTVHIHGIPKVIRGDDEWLKNMLSSLTDQEECKREADDRWALNDAPEPYLDAKLKNIVGLEIEIVRAEGKFKFDQDMSKVDVEGEVKGLTKENGATGREMCKYIQRFHKDDISN